MESGLWNWVRKYLPPGRYSRIESPTSPGIPDVGYTTGGIRGWIELKDAKKATAKQPFKRGGLRPEQINWFREEIEAGGSDPLWILARVGKTIYLVPGIYFAIFNDMTQADLVDCADLMASVYDFRRPAIQDRFISLLTRTQ